MTSLMLKVAETPAEMQKDFEELDFYQQVPGSITDCQSVVTVDAS